MADELGKSGDLITPEWQDAVRSVPRHVLVPYFYIQNEDATWRKVDRTDDEADAWLETIYSDETLITALADLPPDSAGTGRMAVSSSTMPTLMVGMLEALNVHDGNRVLEIGTGTGYNAALLSHRFGDDNVFSVDVDAELVDLAGKRRLHAHHSRSRWGTGTSRARTLRPHHLYVRGPGNTASMD